MAGVAGTLLWTFPEGAGPMSITLFVLDALSKGKQQKGDKKKSHFSSFLNFYMCLDSRCTSGTCRCLRFTFNNWNQML